MRMRVNAARHDELAASIDNPRTRWCFQVGPDRCDQTVVA